MSPDKIHTKTGSREAARSGASTAEAATEVIERAALERLDSVFASAGLVRRLRGRTAGVTHRMRPARLDPGDLFRPAPVPEIAANGVEWIRVPGWQGMKWLWHGFSTRRGGLSRAYCAQNAGGELNLGFTPEDAPEAVRENRKLLAAAIAGNAETPLVSVRQFHSGIVRVAGDSAGFAKQYKGDGLIADAPGYLIGVLTADCVPVLVADRRQRVAAAFHAGWRGTVNRIVESGVGLLRLRFNSRTQDLIAAIGPSIGPCCYAVGEEVHSSFQSQFSYCADLFHEVYDADPIRKRYPMLFLTQRAPGHSPIGPGLHLDLIEANRRQLLAAGLAEQSIVTVGGCTACQPDVFFSHRSSGGRAGRMMAVIGIRPESNTSKGRSCG